MHEQPAGEGVTPDKECGKQKRINVKQDANGYTVDKNGRQGCGSYISASTMICPYCGYTYDTEKELIEAKLKLIDYDIIPEHGTIIKESNQYHEIEKIAESRGYKQGWVVRQIAIKHGFDGLREYAKQKKYSTGWAFMMEKKYLKNKNMTKVI